MSELERDRDEPGWSVVPGRWSRADGDHVICELCPRECRLGEGQRAFCYVRQNRGGEIVLTSWGRASGFCVDPIEKKPLAHFHPGSSVLSFGTAGCNLGCRFCQNWDISKSRADDKLADAAPEALADTATRLGCRSIAFTYNDPVIFAEYAIDCAEAARERGLAAVAVTAGYVSERAREAFFAPMDAANVDLKAFTERFYEKLCFAELAPVLDTIAWLARETDVWLEVTTLLIPGQNDSEEEVARLSEWMVEHAGPEVPLHFTGFHPDYRLLDAPPTPAATLARARRQALEAGMKHVYTGNVRDLEGQATRCVGCGEEVVARDGYAIRRYALDERGACRACGRRLAGRFGERAGGWGARRLPVRIGE
jgi:pyruvate formate lyase activating enzyme